MPLDPRQIEVLDPAMVQLWRSRTPAERLAAAFDCNRTARQLLFSQLRMLHPEWTAEQATAEVARRMCDVPLPGAV